MEPAIDDHPPPPPGPPCGHQYVTVTDWLVAQPQATACRLGPPCIFVTVTFGYRAAWWSMERLGGFVAFPRVDFRVRELIVDGAWNGEIRKWVEPSWMLHRRRDLLHRVGRAGVVRIVPGLRHHQRIIEIPTGLSQSTQVVDSNPLTTG